MGGVDGGPWQVWTGAPWAGVDGGPWVGVDGDPRGRVWMTPRGALGPQVDGRAFPVLPPTVSAAPTTRAHGL